MGSTTYTYRIRLTNLDKVRVEKLSSDNVDMGQPSGRLTFKAARQAELTSLSEKAGYRVSQGETAISEQEIKRLGALLFNTLFDDTLKIDFLLFYEDVIHRKNALLRVELDIDEGKLPSLAALPWEFLFVPMNDVTGELWISTSPSVALFRRRALWTAAKPIQLGPGQKLRIAILVSAPTNEDLGVVDYKRLYRELQGLGEDMVGLVELKLFDPEKKPATRANIDDVLRWEPNIFHFIGHGRFENRGGDYVGEIAVVNDIGKAQWVDAGKFSSLFGRHRPDVVFMQACEGGQLSSSKAFAGVASQIVQQGISVVLAMQYEVSNGTARKFARRFYSQLASGAPVDIAAQEGRNAISDWHETRDFATPVLFMRVRDGRLFVQEAGTSPKVVVEPTPEREPEPVKLPPSLVVDELTAAQRASFRTKLGNYFSLGELQNIAFDLGIDHENLPDSTLNVFTRELISYCERTSGMADLIAIVRSQRTNVDWP